MTRSEKTEVIAELREKFNQSNFFYLTDSSTLTVEEVNSLRRICFQKGVEMKVVKNTLAKKALEEGPAEKGFSELYDLLRGPTTLMFSEQAKTPAQIIEEFRKKHDKPLLKGAYIDTDVFVGDDKLKELVRLKTKEELVGEIVSMLESQIHGVVDSLGSSSQTLFGLLDAIEAKQ